MLRGEVRKGKKSNLQLHKCRWIGRTFCPFELLLFYTLALMPFSTPYGCTYTR